MDWKGLFVKEKNGDVALPEVPVETAVESPTVGIGLATGPLGSKRPAPKGAPRRTTTFATGLQKVNAEKLSDLRKRVLGTEPTVYTQLLEQAAALEEAGITDPIMRFKGAIKTARVQKGDLQDAIAAHKAALLRQREGFGRHVEEVRGKAQARRSEIELEVAELQRRFAEVEAEDASLTQQQQELDAGEQEFSQVADAMSEEILDTGNQILSLYEG